MSQSFCKYLYMLIVRLANTLGDSTNYHPRVVLLAMWFDTMHLQHLSLTDEYGLPHHGDHIQSPSTLPSIRQKDASSHTSRIMRVFVMPVL